MKMELENNAIDQSNEEKKFPSRKEILKAFDVGSIVFLRGMVFKVKKRTLKDLVLRPLSESEIKKLYDKVKKNQEDSKLVVDKVYDPDLEGVEVVEDADLSINETINEEVN